MFGFLQNDNIFNFGATNESNRWGRTAANYEGYEARRQRNEQITRDYFRELYGSDPVELGFEVPDWDWS